MFGNFTQKIINNRLTNIFKGGWFVEFRKLIVEAINEEHKKSGVRPQAVLNFSADGNKLTVYIMKIVPINGVVNGATMEEITRVAIDLPSDEASKKG